MQVTHGSRDLHVVGTPAHLLLLLLHMQSIRRRTCRKTSTIFANGRTRPAVCDAKRGHVREQAGP